MDESVSKSHKKREAHALQQLGVELVALRVATLDLLPLTDPLRKAILDAKLIKSHGAKRRQAQLIGKLMRAADYELILDTYQKILDEKEAITVDFHEVERWRDQLIHNGKEALTEFINSYHPDDVQQLRHLIKKAVDDQLKEKNTGAAKALFRYLRVIIQ